MMPNLSGKTMLLTGASSGIGAAKAQMLAAPGARLVAHDAGGDSARAGAKQAVATLTQPQRALIEADFGDRDAAARLWRQALGWAGRVDAVVLTPAIARMSGGVEDSDEAWHGAWDEQWRISVLAPCDLMRLTVHHWLQTGGGILLHHGVLQRAARLNKSGAALLHRDAGGGEDRSADHLARLPEARHPEPRRLARHRAKEDERGFRGHPGRPGPGDGDAGDGGVGAARGTR
jgi:NAD(P)-dependent dehydrogenase (short-subunit alcohol dehydrogenase family)